MAEVGVRAEFEMFPVLHGLKSQAAGREVYEDEPHVRIRNAGEDKHEFFGPVNEQIRARFPEEWAAFENGHKVAQSGTPIDRWPQLTPGQVRNLKALNIFTVEDVATLTDAAKQKVGMGAQKLVADAQRFLSLAQAAADVAQLDDLREKNATMEGELAALRAMVEKMGEKAEEPRKRKAAA